MPKGDVTLTREEAAFVRELIADYQRDCFRYKHFSNAIKSRATLCASIESKLSTPPEQAECGICGGSGKIHEDFGPQSFSCPSCSGTGKVKP